MKQRFRLLIPIVFIFLLFGSFSAPHSLKDNREVILQLIMQTLRTQHYAMVEINDEFSEKVFDIYIKRLDFGKRYLTQKDIHELRKWYNKIDDEINSGTFNFYEESMNIYRQRFEFVRSLYPQLLENSFDFTVEESIETDFRKMEFATDESALRERWLKLLKYETMTRLSNMINEQQSALERNDTAYKEKSFNEMDQTARERVLKTYDDFFKRMDKLTEDEWFAFYLNAISNAFDPHTEYYPPKEKQNFDIAISGRLEGIGATLQERDDNIRVVHLVPGSASWKQGELKAGDIILKVGQGDEEPVDIVGMRLDDAVQLIRGRKGTVVNLTVKKMDGSIRVISIVRDVVIIEESLVKTAIVEDSKTKMKIAYIKLPQFYTDFTRTGGKGCAADVRQELNKIKKENVNGIVFDLRDNGGGSLQDAVDIAGFFIPKGPIVQVKSRYGSPLVLSDNDPAVLYDGPLVIMVNTLSASASEIFAAAMQDYNRAVVLGSNRTYGKGTVQRFYNLDDFTFNRKPADVSFGALKLTMQKFYRINGATTQLNGVTPDVVVPYIYNYANIGEDELDYPLPWNEIQPSNYTVWTSSLPVDKIVKNSQKRVANNEVFTMIEENSKRIGREERKTLFTLTLEDYMSEMKANQEESKKYENIDRLIAGMKVSQLNDDLKATRSDTATHSRIKLWHDEIVKDAYVYEALQIVGDLR